jgi:hypothetical protein
MVAIYGPSCGSSPVPQRTRDIELMAPEPLLVEAYTLADALAAYTREFGVRFRPYEGSHPAVPLEPGEPTKYFWYEKADGSSMLVDIHIERDHRQICPKQNLSFSLLAGDEVHIGPLVC